MPVRTFSSASNRKSGTKEAGDIIWGTSLAKLQDYNYIFLAQQPPNRFNTICGIRSVRRKLEPSSMLNTKNLHADAKIVRSNHTEIILFPRSRCVILEFQVNDKRRNVINCVPFDIHNCREPREASRLRFEIKPRALIVNVNFRFHFARAVLYPSLDH